MLTLLTSLTSLGQSLISELLSLIVTQLVLGPGEDDESTEWGGGK